MTPAQNTSEGIIIYGKLLPSPQSCRPSHISITTPSHPHPLRRVLHTLCYSSRKGHHRLLPSILPPRLSTLRRNPFTISRICLTLSNSVSSSSICRKMSRNRAISASALAIVLAADRDRAMVEVWVCAVN